MNLFRKTRAAYRAGFRAGLAGARYYPCPYSSWEFMQSFAWFSGWETGMAKRLAITKGVEK